MKYYAHSIEGEPPEEWQLLDEHLKKVSDLAADFADCFNAKKWSLILGQNHDLGKGTLPWQAYLRHANNVVDEFSLFNNGHPPHATVGAQWLFKHSGQAGKLLAYCIAGHHGGLPNWNDSAASALNVKLQQQFPHLNVPHEVPEFPDDLPFQTDPDRLGFQLQFFVRMLFSCLGLKLNSKL